MTNDLNASIACRDNTQMLFSLDMQFLEAGMSATRRRASHAAFNNI